MYTNQIVGQAKPVARLPEMDEAPVARGPKLDARAKRPDAASRPVAAKQPEVTSGSERNPRRYGAGF